MALRTAALAGTVIALIVAAQVSAASHTLRIGDGTADVGGAVSVELEAQGITDPGLGAWTVDIAYDPSIVSVTDCTPYEGGVCNPEYGTDVVRVVGANAAGLEGDTGLADIVFACGDAGGSTALTLTAHDFADATIGGPQDIDATISNGSITCEQPNPTVIPINDFGPLGTGLGYNDRSGLAWLVGALAAAGAVALGLGAFHLAARRP